nr:uncharacterized protein LOC102461030 [Pelodiscus sinensis]|eukprot:XP_025034080.1 uncharacterized protein LOC102461030 [Pelodiscus sinensis]
MCGLTRRLPFQCVLSGSWKSSLGCKMIISGLSETGEFSGSYLPATMAPRAGVLLSPLHGVQHDANRQEQPTFGFTVKCRRCLGTCPPGSTAPGAGGAPVVPGAQKSRRRHTAPCTPGSLGPHGVSLPLTPACSLADSTTVFVGQCFADAHGKETLKTVWLLREEVGAPGASWRATRWVLGTPGRVLPAERDGRAWPRHCSGLCPGWDPDPGSELGHCWGYGTPEWDGAGPGRAPSPDSPASGR